MKIYTKTGDKGSTSLFGGLRVDKDSLRLAAYGTVDELNSQIGAVLSQNPDKLIIRKLVRIQGELFMLGWDLATPIELESEKSKRVKAKRITTSYISRLEREIDKWTKSLPEIKNFILPGGSKVGAGLHLARTIARRAEREAVALSKDESVNPYVIVYLNRLSDWLFTLARYANHEEKIVEVYWKGR